jgi:hydroxymethylbilane synthase
LTANSITIGTRGSELALWQTYWVKEKLLEFFPQLNINIEIIKTTGDKILDVSLSNIGDKGLFTKELEKEMLEGNIDIAVHSLKDLPTKLPPGLMIGAVSEREDQLDAFVSEKYNSIDELPKGAIVATGSLRRKSQLLHYRNDLNITDVRGNVQTRLKRLKENNWDGMILAYAGLHRLGLKNLVKQVIPLNIMLPAVSQGVMAVEIRENDEFVKSVVSVIHDINSYYQILSERSFLRRLEGGCQVPIGAYSEIVDEDLVIEGVVASVDGKELVRDKVTGVKEKAKQLGTELAEKLLSMGADRILASVRNNESIT